MNHKELVKFLIQKPGYLKCGNSRLSRLFSVTEQVAALAKSEAKEKLLSIKKETETTEIKVDNTLFEEFLRWKNKKDEVKTKIENLPKPFLTGDPDNVLVIGDLHEPFCLDKYLEFCREIQEKHNCGTVVFIGDVIDNHYSSYHEAEDNTFGPNEEFARAKSKLKRWYTVFPKAYVTVGNHDRLIHRKAKTAKISSKWIVDLATALETPNWLYVDEIVLNNVCYNHGEGGTARSRMKTELLSQVQGHLHSQFYIDYAVGNAFKVFGMQVGCGINRNSFAFAYGKHGPKPVIGCATVINKGTNPQLHPMNL
jgi:predicted phosphodiesterase